MNYCLNIVPSEYGSALTHMQLNQPKSAITMMFRASNILFIFFLYLSANLQHTLRLIITAYLLEKNLIRNDCFILFSIAKYVF